MLDIGWSELLVVAIVALVVVGPKDLPKLMRTVGVYTGKVRRMAQDFQRQFERAVADSEVDEVAKNIEAIRANMGTVSDFGQAAGRLPQADGRPLMTGESASGADSTPAADETEPGLPEAAKPKRARAKKRASAQTSTKTSTKSEAKTAAKTADSKPVKGAGAKASSKPKPAPSASPKSDSEP